MTTRTLMLLICCLIASGCERTIDWWMTPDQQGEYLYNQGEYSRAARAFEDPLHKGLAFYAAGEFASASAMLSSIDSAYAKFYVGNALAQQDKLAEAVAAYQAAIQMQPEFEEAEFNLNWVGNLLELDQREYDDYGGTGGQLAADEFIVDDRADNAQQEMTQVEAMSQGLSDAQIEELWMRRVQTTPGEFLEIKFSYQLDDTAEPDE